MIEDELANPLTTPGRLQEIATLAPQYAPQIAQHPNAYPELIAWCHQQMATLPAQDPGQTQRNNKVLWSVIGVVAAVVAIFVIMLVLVFNGRGASSEPEPVPAPELTAPEPESELETTPEPEATDDFEYIWLDEDYDWQVVGDVLVNADYDDSSGVQNDFRVSVLQPGEGVKSLFFDAVMKKDPAAQDFIYHSWAVVGDDEPAVVFIAVYRQPGSGLKPPSYYVEAVFVDIDGVEISRTVVVEEMPVTPRIEAVVASSAGTVAVSLREDSDVIYGVAASGGVLWQMPGYIVTESYDTAFIDATAKDEPSNCRVFHGIDVASGKPVWQLGETGCVSGWPNFGPESGGSLRDKVFSLQIESEDPALKELVTGVDLQLPGLPQLYDSVAKQAFYYPALGYNSPKVFDVVSGKVLFELEAEDAVRLEFVARQLFGGLIYAETKDENIVVRVSDGEVLSDWERYPLAQLGEWWLFNDGLLTNEPYDIAAG